METNFKKHLVLVETITFESIINYSKLFKTQVWKEVKHINKSFGLP